MSREIQLTRGLVAIVDDEDYGHLEKHRWRAQLHGERTYAVRDAPRGSVRRGAIFMHREIMDAGPRQDVDHADRNGLDNRRRNLRLASRSENLANQRLLHANTSGFKGVCWDADRGRWLARIRVHPRTIHLGRFADPREAARAYDEAAAKHFGEFARTNESMGLL